jgi:hypothetical protein
MQVASGKEERHACASIQSQGMVRAQQHHAIDGDGAATAAQYSEV